MEPNFRSDFDLTSTASKLRSYWLIDDATRNLARGSSKRENGVKGIT